MSLARTAAFFDGYAGNFDAIYGTRNTLFNRVINRCFRSSMRLRFEHTLAGCQPIAGQTVLDIGCGPGHYGVALARQGARQVFGLEFAPAMIELAQAHAAEAGVGDRCQFAVGDVLTHPIPDVYDYAIVMGFLDYIENARGLIELVLRHTRRKAFFSFPAAGGLLAWQRRLRYRNRCSLYLYTPEQLAELFAGLPCKEVASERLARDYFVTVSLS